MDGRRFGFHGEGSQEFPVPLKGLREILLFLLFLPGILVAGVIMIRQVGQVGFQITQDLRPVIRIEILPVFRLQPVSPGKFLFGFEHQAGESALGLDFDNPHMKIRSRFVEGVSAYKSGIGRSGIGIPALVEVEFTEVAVYAVFITSLTPV